nr:MAG TPA: hypothetical protein [Caudoviricetes sp.]
MIVLILVCSSQNHNYLFVKAKTPHLEGLAEKI